MRTSCTRSTRATSSRSRCTGWASGEPPADAPDPLPPGSTIGILGGGQLGRMLGDRRAGDGLPRSSPSTPTPTARRPPSPTRSSSARYDDADAARRLASMADVVTYELEHVGLEAAAAAGEVAPLRPGLAALRATRDRLAERRFIREIGEWAAPWREVRGVDDARAAADALGYPLRLKAPIGGYDGRSQVRIAGPGGGRGRHRGARRRRRPPAAARGGDRLRGASCRSCARATATGGRSRSPCRATCTTPGSSSRASRRPRSIRVVAADAREIADSLARGLDHVGLLTVELFQLRGGGLMINELAPRVHNSGHWTIEGAVTSQFEQHLRAILGLPLGSVRPHGSAAMVNLLGHRRRTGPRASRGLEARPRRPRRARPPLRQASRVRAAQDGARDGDRRPTLDEALDRARSARAALGWED